GSESLDVGQNQMVKVGMSSYQSAGMNTKISSGLSMELDSGLSIYVNSTMVVIEGAAQLSLKCCGSFIDINPAGVCISGPMVMINSGGAAGSGVGVDGQEPDSPAEPKEAKSSCAGEVEKS